MGHQDQKKKLPSIVRLWMEANDLTVTETAKRIEIEQPTLSNYLQGNTSVSDKLFDKILNALDIKDSALLEHPPALLSDPRRTIPLVNHSRAISTPIITQEVVDGLVPTETTSLHRLLPYCDEARRTGWTRFIAIEVDAEQAEFMQSFLKKERPVVIDRHHQQIDLLFRGVRPIYALAVKGKLVFGHVTISVRNDHLIVSPASTSQRVLPFEIYFDGKPKIARFVVGRVCNILIDV
jgi:transcriptional regulator with XRE-family HTH domain